MNHNGPVLIDGGSAGTILNGSAPSPNRTAQKLAWLELFAETGNAAKSAEAIGIGRGTPWDWRESDPEFAAAWKAVERSLVANGTGTLYTRGTADKSDMPAFLSLMAWLKRHDPEYRESSGNVTVNVTVQANVIAQAGRELGIGARRQSVTAAVVDVPALPAPSDPLP